jgi:hypothetical protein
MMGFHVFSFLPSRGHIELEKYDISILDNIRLPFLFILSIGLSSAEKTGKTYHGFILIIFCSCPFI